MKVFVRTEKRAVEYNAKLKRRFGQTGGHDQRQVNEARRSYKMEESKMADLSVVMLSFPIFHTSHHFLKHILSHQ